MKIEVPTDILHPELYRALSEWRTAKTREVNMPAYVIMQQKALMGIVNLLPDTPVALEAIPYFGAKGVEKYGLEILGIVRKYMKENKLERPEIFTSVSGGEDVREQKLDAQHHEDKKKQSQIENQWQDISERMETEMETFSKEASESSGGLIDQVKVEEPGTDGLPGILTEVFGFKRRDDGRPGFF